VCKKNYNAFYGDPRFSAVFLRVFAIVFACAFACSAIATRLSPRVYFSTVRIKLHTDIPAGEFTFSPDDPEFVNTQVSIIMSSNILDRVITNLTLQHVLARQNGEPDWSLDQTFAALLPNISVTKAPGTSLFSISVKNPDPNLAAEIANSIAVTLRVFRREAWQRPELDDTIREIARPSWNAVARTKPEIFGIWLFRGTVLALMAGGGGAWIALVIRRFSRRQAASA